MQHTGDFEPGKKRYVPDYSHFESHNRFVPLFDSGTYFDLTSRRVLEFGSVGWLASWVSKVGTWLVFPVLLLWPSCFLLSCLVPVPPCLAAWCATTSTHLHFLPSTFLFDVFFSHSIAVLGPQYFSVGSRVLLCWAQV